jgi:GST-like protein
MRTLNTVPTANGQRASIALSECGLEYEVRMVDLMSGEHRSSEMLALNPVGRMPVLSVREEPGEVNRDLYGSLAIATYAAQKAGILIPRDESAADYHQWIGIIMTDLVPAFAGQFYLKVLADEPQEWGVAWYGQIIDHLLNVIDTHLAAHQTIVGNTLSLADLMMYPAAVTSVPRLPQGAGAYPNIEAWAKRLGEREAIQAGMKASS